MTEHPRDDLAAYALGILDADAQRTVGAHLETCTSCRAEARAHAETAWQVAETAGRDAPGRVRSAIVERARGDNAALVRPPGSFWSGLFRPLTRPVPMMVPLALAAVLVVALVGYGSARRDADRYAMVVSSAVGAKVVPLAATVVGMRGSLVVPANGAKPYLILDLPSAPAGKTWEAWVIHDDTPVRAGITDDRGVTTLELGAPLRVGDSVAITAERPGGVDSPTGALVLSGRS